MVFQALTNEERTVFLFPPQDLQDSVQPPPPFWFLSPVWFPWIQRWLLAPEPAVRGRGGREVAQSVEGGGLERLHRSPCRPPFSPETSEVGGALGFLGTPWGPDIFHPPGWSQGETCSTLTDLEASSRRDCHPQPANAGSDHSKRGYHANWLVKVALLVRRAGSFREGAKDTAVPSLFCWTQGPRRVHLGPVRPGLWCCC